MAHKNYFWAPSKPIGGLLPACREVKQIRNYVEYNGIQVSYLWKKVL